MGVKILNSVSSTETFAKIVKEIGTHNIIEVTEIDNTWVWIDIASKFTMDIQIRFETDDFNIFYLQIISHFGMWFQCFLLTIHSPYHFGADKFFKEFLLVLKELSGQKWFQ